MVFAFINPESMVILAAVALVVFGPKRLPEVARHLGTFVREARSMMSHVTDSFTGVGDDVRSAGFSGTDNVMRPRPLNPPADVPYDQREKYSPPGLQPEEQHESAAVNAQSPSLKLTDVSAPNELQPYLAASNAGETILQHDDEHRAAEQFAHPTEVNRL